MEGVLQDAHQLKLSLIFWFKNNYYRKSNNLGAGVRTHFNGGHPFTFGPRHFLTTKVEAYNYLKNF